MPELPEVETVRLGLRPVLEHHRFLSVKTRRGDLRIPFPPRFAARLEGRRVNRLWRRAKYLVAELDSGESLIIHLGMSGSMSVYAEGRDRKVGTYYYDAARADAGAGKHDHVVMETDAPARIVFTDQRRFGLMTLVDTAQLADHPLFKDIGPEPLADDFGAGLLGRALRGKKTSIKAALLDQRVIAGLGNIYACEALFRARLSPRRLAKNLTAGQRAALVRAIKTVLREAIDAGGSSLRDHRRVDGGLGNFQHRFAVYDREGASCGRTCGGTVRRVVQNGRSTFYCPRCQK